MKHKTVIYVLLIAIALTLCGCGSIIPALDRPEDLVERLLTQDNLMELISNIDDYSPEEDADLLSGLMADILTSSSFKSLLLDNVRAIDYSISDATEDGDKATVTALITHLDVTPIMDEASEIFVDKVYTLDSMGTPIPETEEEQNDFILSLLKQSVREAINKNKPSETYTKIRFECEKDSGGAWVLNDVPDDFIDKVLLINLYSAFAESFSSIPF